MSTEELKQSLLARFPELTFEEGGEFLNVVVENAAFRGFIETLKNEQAYDFDYLYCLTCVDWKTNLTMVYHLLSKTHRHELVVKVKLTDLNNPEVVTICDLWKGAELLEREVYDMFGVRFTNHPDLRRLLLDEDWEGYPLRKNYVDENMIEL
jgi:NADH:ubiquinone oxidoreductase subunit C